LAVCFIAAVVCAGLVGFCKVYDSFHPQM
jgi:hypothetical protein